MTTAVAVYLIVVGVVMAGWWANDLRQGAWSRGDRTHGEIVLHLVAEFLTAGWLVTSAISLLTIGDKAVPFVAVSLGMLLYTSIASSGYFLARRELPVVRMFALVVVLTIIGLLALLA